MLMLEHGHSYILLAQSIQLHSAMGVQFEPLFCISPSRLMVFTSRHPHSKSPRVKQLLRDFLCSLGTDIVGTDGLSSNSVLVSGSFASCHDVGMLKCVLWFDGFDPLGTKCNCGSTWVLFATVGQPFGPQHNSYMFLVGMGLANITHDEVFQKLGCELDSINNPDGLLL